MIPWGFGKWTGARGRLVERAYDTYASAGLRLGDTALRPRWLPRPSLFARSERDGRPVFLGSDPFPFADRLGAVAGTGFFLPDAGGGDLTWTKLHARIAELRPPLRTFGGGLSTPTFVSLQARMQLRKRLGTGR